VVAFETEFFVANAFDVLLGNEISFSAQVFATDLRTPSRVLIVIGIISVVPKHVFIMVIKLSRFNNLAFSKRREKLKEHRVRDHNVAVFLLACCVNALATSLNFLF